MVSVCAHVLQLLKWTILWPTKALLINNYHYWIKNIHSLCTLRYRSYLGSYASMPLRYVLIHNKTVCYGVLADRWLRDSMKAWQLAILKEWWLCTSFIWYSLLLGWVDLVLNRHGLWSIWCLKCNWNNFIKWLMSLVIIPHLVVVNSHSKTMIIGHHTASIIANYHTSNMAVIFLDCTLGEHQSPPLSHPDI